MKVKELISKLKEMPQDAELFIGFESFDDVVKVSGRIAKKETWFRTKRFQFIDDPLKQKDTAIMFTRLREFSDGKTDQGII
jgi:hypothetical protein